MSYLSLIARLFHYLIRALTAAHVACRAVNRVESYVARSNASDALKAQAVAVKIAMNELCDAIQTFKNNLPD